MTQQKLDNLNGIGKLILTGIAILGVIASFGAGWAKLPKITENSENLKANADSIVELQRSYDKITTDLQWIKETQHTILTKIERTDQ